ncbi:MAG: CapA family protein [Treponema sp.]|nr:CapA family protein [Treponema sp.]
MNTKKRIIFLLITTFFFFSCKSTKVQIEKPVVPQKPVQQDLTLLFGGDIMAHTVNYQITDYEKIWKEITPLVQKSDLAFANIEAPIDTTKKHSSYPNFNMTYNYVNAAVKAGFNVFSLCNNHTNDQGLTGIQETAKTTKALQTEAKNNQKEIYFSGIKNSPRDKHSYNLIEKNGWKILFLPITELLNRPDFSDYINYSKPTVEQLKILIDYCKELKVKTKCDLFIFSLHTAEPEYTRTITEAQEEYYMNLLNAGVDIIWANHAHIIKDRKFIFDTENQRQKMIMYANGNTISGQRTAPDFKSKNPIGERDNTGDGLLYEVIFSKEEKNGKTAITIKKAIPHFITTYINTANEFVIRFLNKDFVNYLYDVPRINWAEYIKRRIKINNKETKDLIVWQ